MDDNWGNILYLILMALFVIVGALKKKKKPVENYENIAAERAEDEVPVGIENIFDSILGENSFAPQQEHPYHLVEEKNVVDKVEANLVPEDEIKSVECDAPVQLVVEELNDDEEIGEEKDEFDWRQAIISKEILDRKYI